jgi:hypothetical protein
MKILCCLLSILLLACPLVSNAYPPFGITSSSVTKAPSAEYQGKLAKLRLNLKIPEAGSVQDDFAQGLIDGRRTATKYHDASEHEDDAMVGAMVLGVVGGAISYSSAATSRPLPHSSIMKCMSDMSAGYQQGFLSGYEREALSMNKQDAADGFLMGVAIIGVGVLLVVGLNSLKN